MAQITLQAVLGKRVGLATNEAAHRPGSLRPWRILTWASTVALD